MNMEVDFTRAEYLRRKSGEWLCLKLASPVNMDSFVPDKKYTANIKEWKPKKTKDQNAYFWHLCGQLAAKLSMPPDAIITPDMVYREYIRDIGDNYEILPVHKDRIEAFKAIWCNGHIGRYVEDLGECRKTKGYHNLRCYIGCSEYDIAQMNRLISLIQQDCIAQGIEVMTDEELSRIRQ